MNDRFKFRVWDTKQQKYRQRTHHEADTCLNCLTGKVLFGEGIEIYGEEDDKDVIVEQCTGLKDKNGELIYEGDIVREISKKEPEWEEYVTEVKWKVRGFNIYDTADFYFEVIGNIHENKELLDE